MSQMLFLLTDVDLVDEPHPGTGNPTALAILADEVDEPGIREIADRIVRETLDPDGDSIWTWDDVAAALAAAGFNCLKWKQIVIDDLPAGVEG